MISGMDCAACVINIDGTLEETAGVKVAKTNYAQGKSEVEFDETVVSIDTIIKIIKQAGYTAIAE